MLEQFNFTKVKKCPIFSKKNLEKIIMFALRKEFFPLSLAVNRAWCDLDRVLKATYFWHSCTADLCSKMVGSRFPSWIDWALCSTGWTRRIEASILVEPIEVATSTGWTMILKLQFEMNWSNLRVQSVRQGTGV